MNTNHNLLLKFYDSLSKVDGKTMNSCYHPDAFFTDPVFGTLTQKEVTAMWNMLLKNSKGQLQIEFTNVNTKANKGYLTWIATYTFHKTNRKVVNRIKTKIEFKDYLIYRHNDHFSLWKWSGMSLGWKGYLFGWTPFMRNSIRNQAKNALLHYMKEQELKTN